MKLNWWTLSVATAGYFAGFFAANAVSQYFGLSINNWFVFPGLLVMWWALISNMQK